MLCHIFQQRRHWNLFSLLLFGKVFSDRCTSSSFDAPFDELFRCAQECCDANDPPKQWFFLSLIHCIHALPIFPKRHALFACTSIDVISSYYRFSLLAECFAGPSQCYVTLRMCEGISPQLDYPASQHSQAPTLFYAGGGGSLEVPPLDVLEQDDKGIGTVVTKHR
eukprot:RCo010568